MSKQRSRILIVDDERPNIQVLNAILQDEYDVSVALNGEQALKRTLGEKKPDLILLDIQMPEMDGFEVCRQVMGNPQTQDIPVIFITGMTNSEDEEQGFALGAVDYITKPFGPSVVLARIRAHLELKRKRDILKNLSTKDGLTCIANRRYLESFYEYEWQRCMRSGDNIAVIMADIDHFKLYNDNYGHAAGDECLRAVAKVLASHVARQTDLAARYGGEEFACVLPGTETAGAFTVAEKMRAAVRNLAMPHAFSPTNGMVTLSLGVASACPQKDGTSPPELFQLADQALYMAKARGRDQVREATNVALDKPATKPADAEAEDGHSGLQRILIVDDEQINISVLKAIFEGSYRTLSAVSGSHALELAREFPHPDIILLDIQMPEMDGYSVCGALKADPRTRDIPVLFITVLSREADEAKGLKIGAVDYISKPFDPSVVLARVETHLKLRRSLANLARRNKILEETLSLRQSVERIARNDLKRPLLAILGGCEELIQAEDIPVRHEQTIHDMEQSGFALLEMISASIDLWKLERGLYRVETRSVNLSSILRTVSKALARSEKAEQSALVVRYHAGQEPEQDRYMVQGEELLCYGLFFNLVKNALEASPVGQEVSVQVDHIREGLRVCIANAGVIPLEIRTRFMEKGATWGKKGGKGVGAYAARLMAEALGAAVEVKVDDDENRTVICVIFFENNLGAQA
jgi:diguanylate cyclase (GGDEF)-like protein